jgi:hypothetical protein
LAYNNSMSGNVTSPSPQHHRLTRPASTIIWGPFQISPTWRRDTWYSTKPLPAGPRRPPGERCFQTVLCKENRWFPLHPFLFPGRTSASASLRSETQKQRAPARAQPLRLKWTVGKQAPPATTAPRLTRGPPVTNPRDGDPRWRRSERQGGMISRDAKGNQDGNDPSRPAAPFLAASSR